VCVNKKYVCVNRKCLVFIRTQIKISQPGVQGAPSLNKILIFLHLRHEMLPKSANLTFIFLMLKYLFALTFLAAGVLANYQKSSLDLNYSIGEFNITWNALNNEITVSTSSQAILWKSSALSIIGLSKPR